MKNRPFYIVNFNLYLINHLSLKFLLNKELTASNTSFIVTFPRSHTIFIISNSGSVGFASCLGMIKFLLFNGELNDRCRHNTTTDVVCQFFFSNIRNKTRIFLVEHNFVNKKLVLGLIEKFGFKADCAANGSEALKAF